MCFNYFVIGVQNISFFYILITSNKTNTHRVSIDDFSTSCDEISVFVKAWFILFFLKVLIHILLTIKVINKKLNK